MIVGALGFVLSLIALLPVAADDRPAAAPAAPRLTRTILLPGVRWAEVSTTTGFQGRIDHLAYDPATQRLFVAALANHSLEVIDLEKGERIRSIRGLKKPQGIAVVRPTGLVAVACGGDDSIHFFDARSLEEKGSAPAGANADNVRFDRQGGKLYIGCGEQEGKLAIFDARTLERSGELPLPMRPESFQLDLNGPLVFMNCPGPKKSDNEGQVFAIDRVSGRVAWNIVLDHIARNFPLAHDAAHGRLFIATRKPARLIALDARNGRVISEAPCVRDSDDLFYDVSSGQILVIGGGFRADDGSALPTDSAPERPAPPAGDGAALDVFQMNARGVLQRIASTPTVAHARTGLFVPERRAIYVAVPPQGNRDSEIREYAITP